VLRNEHDGPANLWIPNCGVRVVKGGSRCG
jgi:hypothetical protein